MKNKTKIPLFPLEDKSPWIKYPLALLPCFVLLVGYDYFPFYLKQIPISLIFITLFYACWMGGIGPTLLGMVSSVVLLYFKIEYAFFIPLLNSQGISRMVIFFSVMLFTLFLLLKLRTALVSSSRAIFLRDEFLDLASHELKTPLTTLRLNLTIAQQLAQEKDPVAGANFLLESSHRQVARLERLISSMMDLTLFDSGQLVLVKKSCSLKNIMQEMIAINGSPLLKMHDCSEDYLGDWDQNRLEQIISNLLSNAVKYGNNNPIEIRLGRDQNEVWFSIKDQGTGIYPQDLKRIFERFQRANTDYNVQGMGLGLYLTQKLVELHDGSISLQSTPGAGSLFTVKLPA